MKRIVWIAGLLVLVGLLGSAAATPNNTAARLQAQDDVCEGGGDVIDGGGGDDVIINSGCANITGGTGDDQIISRDGASGTIDGGAGDDSFIFENTRSVIAEVSGGEGNNVFSFVGAVSGALLLDTTAGDDTLDFSGFASALNSEFDPNTDGSDQIASDGDAPGSADDLVITLRGVVEALVEPGE